MPRRCELSLDIVTKHLHPRLPTNLAQCRLVDADDVGLGAADLRPVGDCSPGHRKKAEKEKCCVARRRTGAGATSGLRPETAAPVPSLGGHIRLPMLITHRNSTLPSRQDRLDLPLIELTRTRFVG